EVLPRVIGATQEAQIGSFVLEGVEPEISACHETQIQILEAIMLIVVEPADEEAGREVAGVGPTPPDGARPGAADSVEGRGAVDLGEGGRQLVVMRDPRRVEGGGQG